MELSLLLPAFLFSLVHYISVSYEVSESFQVECMDVNSAGECGVSADREGNVFVWNATTGETMVSFNPCFEWKPACVCVYV